jgi:hypothetical protein
MNRISQIPYKKFKKTGHLISREFQHKRLPLSFQKNRDGETCSNSAYYASVLKRPLEGYAKPGFFFRIRARGILKTR